jgi:hypothetical protein
VRGPPSRQLVNCSNELIVRQSPASKAVITEAEGSMALEAITR